MKRHSQLIANCLKIQRGQGENQRCILDGSQQCSFTLKSGKFYYLAGQSGVGKSSLLWSLARLNPLISGHLQLNNTQYQNIPVTYWRAEVALLPQKPVIIAGNIADNLLYPLHDFHIQKKRLHEQAISFPDTHKIQKELNLLGLEDIDLEREANSLSGGQQARLALIRLLLTRPQVILADEPTAGVDKKAAQLVFKRLRQFCQQEGGIVVLTDHHFSEVCDGKIVLDGQGKCEFSYV